MTFSQKHSLMNTPCSSTPTSSADSSAPGKQLLRITDDAITSFVANLMQAALLLNALLLSVLCREWAAADTAIWSRVLGEYMR
jgi:hypothetical protein